MVKDIFKFKQGESFESNSIFVAYAKDYVFSFNVNVQALNSLPNVNIINSIALDGGVNFGKMDRINMLVKDGYNLCPATTKEGKGKYHCGENCMVFIEKEKVCFLWHR